MYRRQKRRLMCVALHQENKLQYIVEYRVYISLVETMITQSSFRAQSTHVNGKYFEYFLTIYTSALYLKTLV